STSRSARAPSSAWEPWSSATWPRARRSSATRRGRSPRRGLHGGGAREMTTVSPIKPCCNYGEHLEGCVASVLNQHGVDDRVQIIEDATTDRSASVGEVLAARDSGAGSRPQAWNSYPINMQQGLERAGGEGRSRPS